MAEGAHIRICLPQLTESGLVCVAVCRALNHHRDGHGHIHANVMGK